MVCRQGEPYPEVANWTGWILGCETIGGSGGRDAREISRSRIGATILGQYARQAIVGWLLL